MKYLRGRILIAAGQRLVVDGEDGLVPQRVLGQVRAALDTPAEASIIAHAQKIATQLRRLADGNDWALEWDKPGDLEALVDDVLDQLDRLGHLDD